MQDSILLVLRLTLPFYSYSLDALFGARSGANPRGARLTIAPRENFACTRTVNFIYSFLFIYLYFYKFNFTYLILMYVSF